MISATQKVSGWSLVASSGKKGGCSVGLERLEHEPVRMDALRGVHDEANEVDLLDCAARGLLHEGTEPAGGRVEPGRVDEDDLRAREVLDAGDPVARRLRARRDDRELLADEAIQEGRLARVRAADERNEPCAGHGWPETRRDPAPSRTALFIPEDPSRAAGAPGGGPTRGSAARAHA